jgi:hypothetical protein
MKTDESLYGVSPVVLMFCLDRSLLMELTVALTKDENATEVRSGHGGGIVVGGVRARIVCLSPDSLSFTVIVVSESFLQEFKFLWQTVSMTDGLSPVR